MNSRDEWIRSKCREYGKGVNDAEIELAGDRHATVFTEGLKPLELWILTTGSSRYDVARKNVIWGKQRSLLDLRLEAKKGLIKFCWDFPTLEKAEMAFLVAGFQSNNGMFIQHLKSVSSDFNNLKPLESPLFHSSTHSNSSSTHPSNIHSLRALFRGGKESLWRHCQTHLHEKVVDPSNLINNFITNY